MKFKCPNCEDATMTLDEDKQMHVCESCSHEISEADASDLFEKGQLVAEAEENEVADKIEEEESITEDQVDELSIKLSSYDSVNKIIRAGKKGNLDENWVSDYVEAIAEGTEINVHKVDVNSVLEWAKELVAESEKVSKDLVEAFAKDENLSEEAKEEITIVFEAAVNAKAKQIKDSIEEEFDAKLKEKEAEIRESVEAEVDGYLDTVVAEWMEENKLAIESGIKSDMVESFMSGLKDLFEEHYIDVPEGKEDIIESLAKQVEERNAKIAEMEEEEAKVMAKVVEMEKDFVFKSVSEGLADTQVEKLKALSESVEFTSRDEYSSKLSMLKDKFISEDKPAVEEYVDDLVENEEDKPAKSNYSYVEAAAAALKFSDD